jgi:steroid 5-alpha reductase family enzyme
LPRNNASCAVGIYLFHRILADGKDSRFDKIKKSPRRFLIAFLAQATWVSLTLMPVLAINSLPLTALSALPLLRATDILGLSLYAGGLALEVVADRQKSAWAAAKRRKEHDEDFLMTGWWARCRHPNYFGECALWTGVAITTAAALATRAGMVGMGLPGAGIGRRALALGMCVASPAFVTFLLLKISGVPLSENKYDAKYGHRKDYQEWKRNTPMLIPKF